jgi:3,4-dihydroxy-2-butanone 4-phosphate synthase
VSIRQVVLIELLCLIALFSWCISVYKEIEVQLNLTWTIDLNIPNSILLSITNKMQRYTIFSIAVNAVHVAGGFSAQHQELKTVHTASGICQACLLLPLDFVCTVLSS